MRQKNKLAACIKLTIRYFNFEDVTKQATISYTSLDATLITKAKDLFKQLYQKRMLIRLAGIRLSNLVSGFEQINLYSASQEQYNLLQAMDKIRKRYGEKSITLASTLA